MLENVQLLILNLIPNPILCTDSTQVHMRRILGSVKDVEINLTRKLMLIPHMHLKNKYLVLTQEKSLCFQRTSQSCGYSLSIKKKSVNKQNHNIRVHISTYAANLEEAAVFVQVVWRLSASVPEESDSSQNTFQTRLNHRHK